MKKIRWRVERRATESGVDVSKIALARQPKGANFAGFVTGIFLRFLGRHQSSFCVILSRKCDAIAVNAFAKLYFVFDGPFRLPLHQAMISLPILSQGAQGGFDERFFEELSFW